MKYGSQSELSSVMQMLRPDNQNRSPSLPGCFEFELDLFLLGIAVAQEQPAV